MKKNILALLMALVMLTGLMPVSATAANEEPLVTYSIFDVVIPFKNMVDCYRTTYTTVGSMQQVNNFNYVYSGKKGQQIKYLVPDVIAHPDDYYYRFSKSRDGTKIVQTLYKHSDPTFSFLMADDGFIQTYGDNCFIYASGSDGYYGTFVSFREKNYHRCYNQTGCHSRNYPHESESSLDSSRRSCILCGCGETFIIRGYNPDMTELENLPLTEGLVNIDHTHRYNANGKCPCGKYEQKAEVDTSEAGGYSQARVDGLDSVLAQHQSSASAVRVFLKVTEKTDNQEEQNAIAQMSGKEHLDFLDLSLIKSVNNQEAQDIGADNTVMLTITIPYSSAGKKNISVYRYHDGEVNVLTGIPNENGEYILVGKNELVLHAMKFSTYAVGYNEKVEWQEGMTYEYAVAPTYTVTIPSNVTLGETCTVSAENVVVGYEEYVYVSVNGDFTLMNESGDVITFDVIKDGEAVMPGKSILAVYPGGNPTGSTELVFDLPQDLKYPGNYTGTVTFTIAVNPAVNN